MSKINTKIRHRATAIIYKDEKLLLFRRVKPNAEYFVFPGGGTNEGETIEEALLREVQEELSLDVLKYDYLFTIKDLKINNSAINYSTDPQDHHYFLITEFHGVPELGGPEKESADENNKYFIEWHTFNQLNCIQNIYPGNIVSKLMESMSRSSPENMSSMSPKSQSFLLV
ncbi:MAG: NUDIX domain-containing protein [Candidatus Taylorbacteria bacterium]